jgi:type IV pilus assembly protein PilB
MATYKRITNKFLGELLIEKGIITQVQLDKAVLQQKDKGGLIGEILVNLGFATEQDIAMALTSQYGFPYLPLSNYEIEEEVLSSLAREICERFCLVPIDRIGSSLTLAMADPLNAEAVEEIEAVTKCSVQTFVSTAQDIRQTIEKYFK